MFRFALHTDPPRRIRTKPPPHPSLVLHLDPPVGSNEQALEAFYKRGFALTDTRSKKELAKAYDTKAPNQSWSTLRDAGVQLVTDAAGKSCKVLWAPELPASIMYEDGPNNTSGSWQNHFLVFLDGPDKGSTLRYSGSSLNHCGRNDAMPIFQSDATPQDKDIKLPGETPKVGKVYLIWLPAMQRLWGPYAIASSDKSGAVTRLNFGAEDNWGCTRRMVLRKDLEETTKEDFYTSDGGMPMICGSDAVFIPVDAELNYGRGCTESPANISGCSLVPPANFVPLTMAAMNRALSTSKQASIVIGSETDGHWISLNGKRRAEGLSRPQLAVKLARDLRLAGSEAEELALKAASGPVSFELVRVISLPRNRT